MNIQELTTWNRLVSLEFDAADVAFPFSARLARENGWMPELARKAIEEYRKFCFLATHAGDPVTPSDEVDQVWHLHLTYSRHYWETLCRDTLGRSLHHGPTEGGADEDRKFRAWYEDTLASYRRYFGEPPRDLWPCVEERFDARHDFVRIDRRDVVTLDRTLLKRGVGATLGAGARTQYLYSRYENPTVVAVEEKLAALDCAILITPHPSASDLRTRLGSPDGLVDRGRCAAYAAAIAGRLAERLATEAESSTP